LRSEAAFFYENSAEHPVATEQKSIHRCHKARADRATTPRDEQITVSERIDPIAFHVDRPTTASETYRLPR
jgi:hypothetical protein